MKMQSVFYISISAVLTLLLLSCQQDKKPAANTNAQVAVASDTTLTENRNVTESPDVAIFKNVDFNLQLSYPGSFKSEQKISAVGLNGEIKSTELRLTDTLSDNQIKIKYYPENQALKIYNQLKSRDGYAIERTNFSETTLVKNETILTDGKGNQLENPTIIKSLYFLSSDNSRLYEVQFRAQQNNQEFIDDAVKSIDFLN
jgi:hypothetical protein